MQHLVRLNFSFRLLVYRLKLIYSLIIRISQTLVQMDHILESYIHNILGALRSRLPF